MKKPSRLHLCIGCLILLLLALALFFFRSLKNTELSTITLEEFERYVQTPSETEDQTLYIYVGRDSCPDCAEVYPFLCQLSRRQNLGILYYNTGQDRETRAERMTQLLDQVKIHSVPAVLEIADGAVVALYSGEDFLSLFS